MSKIQRPTKGEPVNSTGGYLVPIYFDREELSTRSNRCIFDDPTLRCERYPRDSDFAGISDVFDEANGVVFRKFARHGPFERGEPIVFLTADIATGALQWRGTFVTHGSEDGVSVFALTKLQPAEFQGNQREALDVCILDDCNFPRLTQYAAATKRDSLSRFQEVVFAEDGRLTRFHDHLRYYKIKQDYNGRGFDYAPKITSMMP